MFVQLETIKEHNVKSKVAPQTLIDEATRSQTFDIPKINLRELKEHKINEEI